MQGGHFFPSAKKSKEEEEKTPQERHRERLRARKGKDNDPAKEGFPTIFALLEAQPHLRPPSDTRHQTTIAVADQGNDRVTLFGYVPRSQLFPATVRGIGFIGDKSGYMKMKEPSSVSFTRWGDLAVCDMGNKRVMVIGPDHSLAHVVGLDDHSLPVGVHPAHCLEKPVSATWDKSGRLVVATKSSTVAVFDAPKRVQAGVLGRLNRSFMVDVLATLDYRMAEVLRGVCKFFHDLTKQMRDDWELYPLQTPQLAYVKQLFVDWCRDPEGRKVKDSEAHDYWGKPVCRRYMQGTCNRTLCPMSHNAPKVDAEALDAANAIIELDHGVYCAVCELFGVRWWWEHEFQIRTIFNSESEACQVEERWDPMTRAVETIREEDTDTVQVIRFDEFVEMFTWFMESHLSLVDLSQHPALRSREARDKAPFRGVGLSALENHIEIFNFQSAKVRARPWQPPAASIVSTRVHAMPLTTPTTRRWLRH